MGGEHSQRLRRLLADIRAITEAQLSALTDAERQCAAGTGSRSRALNAPGSIHAELSAIASLAMLSADLATQAIFELHPGPEVTGPPM